MSFFTPIAKLLLPALFVAGILGTHYLAYHVGMFDHGTAAFLSKRLPESRIVLKTVWTGLESVDQFLGGMVCFFWGTVNNKHPSITLQAIHFLGQLSSIWCLAVLESFRVGNSWTVVAFITLWGLGLEFIGMAIAMPLYFFVYLLKSPIATGAPNESIATQKRNLLVHPVNLRLLPWTLAIGHFVPAAMLQILDDNTTHPLYLSKQFWILARLVHPVTTAALHLVLSMVIPSGTKAYVSAEQRNREVLRSLNNFYTFAIFVAAVPHIGTLTLVTLSQIAHPIFVSKYRSIFSPYAIWWPKQYFWNNPRKVNSVAEGMALFLQYDELVSVSATLIWAIAMNRQAVSKLYNGSNWFSMLLRVLLMTIVGGPAAAAISLIQERDQEVLDAPDISEEKKVK